MSLSPSLLRALAPLTLLMLASQLSACSLIAMKRQSDQMAAQQAAQIANAEEMQREAQRQQQIGLARQTYLEQQLDAYDFSMPCSELRDLASKEMVKNGLSISYESNDTMLLSDWSYVNAEYGHDRNYRLQKTRKSSKNRQLAELSSSGEGLCKLKAFYLQVVEGDQTYRERATDFEATMIKNVEPAKYEEIERGYTSIGQDPPADSQESGSSAVN